MPEPSSNNPDKARQSARQDRLPLQIRHKIALSFALLLLVVTVAFWLLFRNELNRSIDDYSDILGASLAQQTAASVRELVLANDLLGLNVVLTQLVRDDNILFASVHDVDDNTLANAGQAGTGKLYSADITVQDAIAGSVIIHLDTRAKTASLTRIRNLFLLVLAASLILVVTTAFALAGRITTPLRNLAQNIGNITGDDNGEGDNPADETAQLQDAVDRLLGRYQELEGRLLETGVWQGDRNGAMDEPVKLTASLLVIKVVNIHTAIELLHPETLSGLLQEYLFYLKQAARLYGGEFHRLHGESVVVCFDENTCGDMHSINALYCAGLFLSLMARVNNRHRKQGEQSLEFRMAIHSGDVFMTPSADESYNILGKTLDVTYFLSKQGMPNELVISESTRSQAREYEDFEPVRQREMTMPADNVIVMAYILSSGFAEDMGSIRKQRRHILGAPDIQN